MATTTVADAAAFAGLIYFSTAHDQWQQQVDALELEIDATEYKIDSINATRDGLGKYVTDGSENYLLELVKELARLLLREPPL